MKTNIKIAVSFGGILIFSLLMMSCRMHRDGYDVFGGGAGESEDVREMQVWKYNDIEDSSGRLSSVELLNVYSVDHGVKAQRVAEGLYSLATGSGRDRNMLFYGQVPLPPVLADEQKALVIFIENRMSEGRNTDVRQKRVVDAVVASLRGIDFEAGVVEVIPEEILHVAHFRHMGEAPITLLLCKHNVIALYSMREKWLCLGATRPHLYEAMVRTLSEVMYTRN